LRRTCHDGVLKKIVRVLVLVLVLVLVPSRQKK
jgi:hypothetical protein